MPKESFFEDKNFERAQKKYDETKKSNELLDMITNKKSARNRLLELPEVQTPLIQSQIHDLDVAIAKINAELSALYSAENN